jgi:hypothetical protein
MIARALKLVALVVGGFILILLIGVGVWIVADRIAYEKADITTALLRDGRYDPAEHFTFERACTYPPEGDESWRLFERGYRHLDLIYLPDTFTHWTLVLIDDSKKTYRILYAVDPVVNPAAPSATRKLHCEPKYLAGASPPMSNKRGHIRRSDEQSSHRLQQISGGA